MKKVAGGRQERRNTPCGTHWLTLLACLTVNHLPAAAPYLPSSDDQVLERLPQSANPELRGLQALRLRLAETPDNVELAAELARRYIEVGRAESDPRYNGYAEGVLSPWLKRADPPAAVLLLRATLRQNRHEFDAALEDLAGLLAQNPRNAPAWLTRAVILQVRGDYRGAERACLNLMPLAERLLSLTCLASVRSLAGQAEKSYALLREALVPAKDAPSPARLWALTTLAETAHRNGYDRDAEDSFRAALDTAPRDAYLLAAYADFLLDHRRPEPVVALLARQVRIDGLLLRLALAEQLLGTADFASHRDELAARFAASRLRGDTSHQGDEARFTLHLMHDPARALALAEANWSVQREPRDARILLEAALAAHRSEAARPVLEFIERYGLQDQRLSALREQLGKIRL